VFSLVAAQRCLWIKLRLPGANFFYLLGNYSEGLLMVDLQLLAGEVRQALLAAPQD
jgi:hypothetical protein